MRRTIAFLSIVSLIIVMAACGNSPSVESEIPERPVKGYKTPPPEIADLINSVSSPYLSFDSKGEKILLIDRPDYPSIRQLDSEEKGLAGIRLNPDNYGPSQPWTFSGLRIMDHATGETIPITGLPDDAACRNFSWSPDSSHIAFNVFKKDTLELWVVDAEKGKAKKLAEDVNSVYWGDCFAWDSFSKSIFYKKSVRELADKICDPISPVIKESNGKGTAQRTFTDLLKDETDANLFEAYATVQLTRVDLSGKEHKIGPRRMIIYLDISPNGKYILVESTHRPFSYTVPAYRFPRLAEIWDTNGKMIATITDEPLMEDLPSLWEAAEPGKRNLHWRSDEPATLFYVVAQDEGDPRNEVEFRDKGYLLKAPFEGEGKEIFATKNRFKGISWGRKDLAVVYERWYYDRLVTRQFLDPTAGTKREVFCFNLEDAYGNPGDFLKTKTSSGHEVLMFSKDGQHLYLKGKGASPNGPYPFVKSYDILSGETKELFKCRDGMYEYVIKMNYPQEGDMVIRRETSEDFPNYFQRLADGQERALTEFPYPYPDLKGLKGEVIKYKRKDGVQLSAKLYLPRGYKKEDGPLPVLMWVYPREFKSASTAGQIKTSDNRFTYMDWWSQAIWVNRGYAVFDGPTMPIIGEGDDEPNDTYIEQLIMGAKAAVEKVKSMGISDGNNIAIGGHSYGSFTAANLVAHTDLFTTAICRTGAYNRTLTPFGFQSERRTLWEAPETYIKMSPFMHADKIKEPVLLIHGSNDSNPGTFPIQSERFYDALKAHGVDVRLVMLPFEDHSYKSRESVMHVLWETDTWLEKYLKDKGEKNE